MILDPHESKPSILAWDETRLSLVAIGKKEETEPDLLFLQKTFLPGWKAFINGEPVKTHRDFDVFVSLPLLAGENRVELTFQPAGLRLGFFLFFTFFGVFSFFLIRRVLA